MSDQFPMPKTIGDLPAASPRDYAPKRGLEAVAAEIERTPPRTPPYAPYVTPPSTSPGSSQHTATIKDAIKKLTHREMREMVAAIFEAHVKLHGDLGRADNGDAIGKDRLADVLDAFAYGQ